MLVGSQGVQGPITRMLNSVFSLAMLILISWVVGGWGGGGVLHILKHRFLLKIVFVKNSNKCIETLNGTDYLVSLFAINTPYVFLKIPNWAT